MCQTRKFAERPWLEPGASPFIQVSGISKAFGQISVLDKIDLQVYRGELFSLLGGSGCGKTTLLRILAGLEAPSSGRVLIDGVDVTNLPAHQRPVNMMFQSYALFPHMNVTQNVEYGLKRDGIDRREINRRTKDMLALLELSTFAQRKPHQLSGGQRQRVALARALVKRPKLLLLDEPLAALDKRLREQTQYELMRIQHQLGVTFLLVTHDQEEAMTLSSRIAVMDEGRLIQVGTPTDLYEYPDNRFIASFIGSVNLFEGHIVKQEHPHCAVLVPPNRSEFYVVDQRAFIPGQHVWIALRPEKISISKHPVAANIANQLTGTIDNIAYTGSQSTYQIKTSTGDIVEVTQSNQNRPDSDQFVGEWNDTVHLQWDANDALLLMN
ncbi:MAG: ABC transporter ATP-binding protein [Pseudomonadota bacterium]|nr:ABC transporter ATP-binding protein [Pseudomonadota bacterium]